MLRRCILPFRHGLVISPLSRRRVIVQLGKLHACELGLYGEKYSTANTGFQSARNVSTTTASSDSGRQIDESSALPETFTSLPDSEHVVGEYGSLKALKLINHNDDTAEKVVRRIGLIISPSYTAQTELVIEVAKHVHIVKAQKSGANTSIVVTFGRSTKGNSLDPTLLDSLATVFESLKQFDQIKGVLLMGSEDLQNQTATRNFCAGANVPAMMNLEDQEQAATFIKRINRLCTAVRHLPAPVIAGVDGSCIGAGLELAASCDIRVATLNSTFSMPEVLLAIPSVVEARLLCEIIGWGRTRHLLLTGDSYSSGEAFDSGLISMKFESRMDLVEWVLPLFDRFNTCLDVHVSQKSLMRQWENLNIEDGIAAGVLCFSERFTGPQGDNVRRHISEVWASSNARKRKAVGKTEAGAVAK